MKQFLKFYFSHLVGFLLLSGVLDYVFVNLLGVETPDKVKPEILDYFLAIIVIPIIETLIFQKLPIDWSIKNNKGSMWLVIAVTGLLFGLSHYTGFPLVITFIVSGMYLSYIYYNLKQQEYYPFVLTVLAHGVLNALVVVTSALGG